MDIHSLVEVLLVITGGGTAAGLATFLASLRPRLESIEASLESLRAESERSSRRHGRLERSLALALQREQMRHQTQPPQDASDSA